MPENISEHLMVIDRDTNEEVRSVVILDPINDRHARAAMLGYAKSVEPTKPDEAFKIRRFIARLDEKDQQRKERSEELPDWLIEQVRGRASDNGSESN